tara:strand:+ start:25723 stop:25989 length:267 start_codon:yes stop_codon:yes gene_type:complete
MIEGKLANRSWANTGKGGFSKCEKCKKQLPAPELIVIGNKANKPTIHLGCQSYIGTEYFIYETVGGDSVCYCSKYCAKKHNHRFKGDS